MDTATTATYQSEPLSDSLWSELEPLLGKHWSEVETERDFPPVPDKALYGQIQDCGRLKVYTARVADELVGYFAAFVSESMHSKGVLLATGDALFIAPAHRGGAIGIGLVRFAKLQLRALGCRMAYITSKHRPDINIGPLLHRLGFHHDEDVWAIRLDEE